MSVTYGFYNSMDHDRVYNARQVSQIFDGIIQDGVYETLGGALMVVPNSGMTITVRSGRAWFNHTWTYNDADMPITLEGSNPITQRIDAIILEIDESATVRANSIKVLRGTDASVNPQKPTLVNDSVLHQYPLAYVTIGINATAISAANIENCVGTTACPFVIGAVSSMDASELYAKWDDQWNKYLVDALAAYKQWETDAHTSFNTWEDDEKTAFYEWLEHLKEILDENVAGHLQLEIEALQEKDVVHENTIVNAYGYSEVVDGELIIHDGVRPVFS